jgi:hypothetical protein
MLLKYGEMITLSDGMPVKLLDGTDGKAFVEFPHLIEREVTNKDGSKSALGLGNKAWVSAESFLVVKDKYGHRVGLAFLEEGQILAPVD